MVKDEMNAESLLHIARGFSRSRILLTAVELDVFTHLADDPLTGTQVAGTLGSDPRATTILLDALVAMDLLVKEEGRYRTEPGLVQLLTPGAEVCILPALRHSAHLFRTWSHLTDVIMEGGPAVKAGTVHDDQVRSFIGAMHVGAMRNATDVVQAVDPGNSKNLLDVGGGSGSYTIGFLRAVADMQATLFDLPDVIPLARERISEEGFADRVTLVPGDYNQDILPGGHDLAFLSAVIHQNSNEQNVSLYEKVYGALVPGGRIVIRDYAMSDDRTYPASGALFAVNMLVNTQGGNSYTFHEIKEGLENAGFIRVKLLQGKEMSSLVEAWKT